eukprot:7099047-Prymnesium_polylepis.1
MAVPYRSGVFDAALSIAVLHHISSVERRRLLLSETLRVLRPGGKALFYAWAKDQQAGRSGHVFPSPDVFVPFHQRMATAKEAAAPSGPTPTAAGAARGPAGAEQKRSREEAERTAEAAASSATAPKFDAEKRAVVHQRYCHVYAEGELRALVESLPDAIVVDEYYDTGNWCVLVEKADVAAPGAPVAVS